MKSYKDLNFNNIRAKYEFALNLINGKDVIEGGEYIGSAIDPEEEKRGYLIVSDLYDEVKLYEDEITKDAEAENNRAYYGVVYSEPLFTYYGILQVYHKDVAPILPYIKPTEEIVDNISNNTSYKETEFLNFFSGKCSVEWKEMLVNDIRSITFAKPTGREIVALAYILYNCDKLHKSMKPNTFSKWLAAFCKCWNIAKVPTSKPNAVEKEISEMEQKIYYLNR